MNLNKTKNRTSRELSLIIEKIIKDLNLKFKLPNLPKIGDVDEKLILEPKAIKEVREIILNSKKESGLPIDKIDFLTPETMVSEKEFKKLVTIQLVNIWNKLPNSEQQTYRNISKLKQNIIIKQRKDILLKHKQDRMDYLTKICKKHKIKTSTIINIIGVLPND